MFYAPDLSPFCADDGQPEFGLLNVGWISPEESYARGPVPPMFVDALRSLTALTTASEQTGEAQLRVPSASGITYVAPVQIVRLVEEHEYQPPAPFIQAVLRKLCEEQEAKESRQASVS